MESKVSRKLEKKRIPEKQKRYILISCVFKPFRIIISNQYYGFIFEVYMYMFPHLFLKNYSKLKKKKNDKSQKNYTFT